MSTLKSWTVSDALWARVAALIPKRKRDKTRKYRRRPGGGRKRMEPRHVFEAIVYVLRTGCQWRALPKEYGSPSSVHQYFLEWKQCGVFEKMWRKGLAEYDKMEKIAWSWQSIDGTMVKAPMALEVVGPNPTDRGKKRDQTQPARRRPWNPAVVSRKRGPAPRRETVGSDPGRHRGPSSQEGHPASVR